MTIAINNFIKKHNVFNHLKSNEDSAAMDGCQGCQGRGKPVVSRRSQSGFDFDFDDDDDDDDGDGDGLADDKHLL